jgi:ankyrin repeat protein
MKIKGTRQDKNILEGSNDAEVQLSKLSFNVYNEDPNVQDLVLSIKERNLKEFKKILDTNNYLLSLGLVCSNFINKSDNKLVCNLLHLLLVEGFEAGINYTLDEYEDQLDIEALIVEDDNLVKKTEESINNIKNSNIIQPAQNVINVESGHVGWELSLYNIINKPKSDYLGASPLILAAENGYTEVVKVLLAKGAKLERATINGYTSITLASQNGHTDVVILLLEHGADVNETMNNGNTPLIMAAQEGHIDVVKLLLDKGAEVDLCMNNKAPQTTIYTDNALNALSRLLNGIDTNKTTSNGDTSLILAASKGHIDVVKLLLNYGAGINIARNDGATPLILAAQEGHIDVVKLLLDKGAEVDKAMNDGTTPLIVAAENGCLELVKLLIDKGAEVNKKALISEMTPLMMAVQTVHIETVNYLIKRGADVSATTYAGFSSLTMATSHGHKDIIKVLLKTHDIDLSDKQESNNYLLQLAIEKGFDEIYNVFELYKCFRSIVDGLIDKSSIMIYLLNMGENNMGENIGYLGELAHSYFYYKAIKLIPESINHFIAQLELNVSMFKGNQEISYAKSFNLMLHDVKTKFLEKEEEIRQDLELIERFLVETYDPAFKSVIQYNSLAQPGNHSGMWVGEKFNTEYIGKKSFLGLIGRRDCDTGCNGYIGEVYGQGKIFEKFISKLNIVQKQELFEPILLNETAFNDFCELFSRVKYNLPKITIDKVSHFIKEVKEQLETPTFKLLIKVIDKYDELIEKVDGLEKEHEKKLCTLEKQNNEILCLLKTLVKGIETKPLDIDNLKVRLSDLSIDTLPESINTEKALCNIVGTIDEQVNYI